MIIFLRIVAIIAAIMLLVQLGYSFYRVRTNAGPLSHQRVVINCVLVAVLVVAAGGSKLLQMEQRVDNQINFKTSAKVSSSSSSSHKKVTTHKKINLSVNTNTNAKIKFKKRARLNKKGRVKVTFVLPAKATMRVQRQSDQQIVERVRNKSDQVKEYQMIFQNPGKYYVIGINGKHKIKQPLTILAAKVTESSGYQTSSSTMSSYNTQTNNTARNYNTQSSSNQTGTILRGGTTNSQASASTQQKATTNNSGSQANNSTPGYHIEYRRELVPIDGSNSDTGSGSNTANTSNGQ